MADDLNQSIEQSLFESKIYLDLTHPNNADKIQKEFEFLANQAKVDGYGESVVRLKQTDSSLSDIQRIAIFIAHGITYEIGCKFDNGKGVWEEHYWEVSEDGKTLKATFTAIKYDATVIGMPDEYNIINDTQVGIKAEFISLIYAIVEKFLHQYQRIASYTIDEPDDENL